MTPPREGGDRPATGPMYLADGLSLRKDDVSIATFVDEWECRLVAAILRSHITYGPTDADIPPFT